MIRVDDIHYLVLDHGYVRLADHMGSDLAVANDARVSFDKESMFLSPADIKLIRFLASRHETSPFRHSIIKLECYAPLMIARQWWKYNVGSSHLEQMDLGTAWNESSRRYITEEPVFYIPTPHQWRGAPKNKKQGSDGFLADHGDFGKAEARGSTNLLEELFGQALDVYHDLLKTGIAPEQARLALPSYAMYVRWRWTASLQAVAWFLTERLAHKAQWELNQYAQAVYHIVKPVFPISIDELLRANGLDQETIEEVANSTGA